MQTSRCFLNRTGLLASLAALAAAFFTVNVEAQNNSPVQNVPVDQTVGGRHIVGTLTITDLAVPPGGLTPGGELLASGVLRGTVDGKQFRQTFTDVTATLGQGASGARSVSVQQVALSCSILSLDLGPLFLDLLGLQVDLSPITLDITAVAGPGNLLGNLLCAVTGLLDPPLLGSFLGQVSAILTNLLDAINQLL